MLYVITKYLESNRSQQAFLNVLARIDSFLYTTKFKKSIDLHNYNWIELINQLTFCLPAEMVAKAYILTTLNCVHIHHTLVIGVLTCIACSCDICSISIGLSKHTLMQNIVIITHLCWVITGSQSHTRQPHGSMKTPTQNSTNSTSKENLSHCISY